MRPRRALNLVFAGFALAFGVGIFAANVGFLVPVVGGALLWIEVATIPLEAAFLAAVALLFPRPLRRDERPAAAAAAFVALAAAAFVALGPRSYADFVAWFGFYHVPSYVAAVARSFTILAFVFALLLLALRYGAARGLAAAAERRQIALVSFALALYPATRTGMSLLGYVVVGAPDSYLLLAAPAAVALLLVAAAWLRNAARADGREARDARHLALAVLAAMLVGAAAWLVTPAGRAPFDIGLLGLARVAGVGVLAFAIARRGLFDLDIKVKAGLRRLLVLAAFAAAFVLAWLAATRVAPPSTAVVIGVLAASLTLVVLPTVRRAAARLADAAMPGVDASEAYLSARKLDVYREALDVAIRGGEGPEGRFLLELRRSLGVSEAEHRALALAVAQQDRGGPRAARAKFAVERELGQGGSGRVLLARDRTLDRLVVLKQPLAVAAQDPATRERFLHEARLAARIDHPNVVAVHEVLDDEEAPVLVLPYVPGGSLADVLRARGRLPPDEVLRLARGLLAGLARIHREGIVHRDIKPANILLDASGVAKITDFGVAHARASLERLASAGLLGPAGTAAYMAPEQARGDPVDARSDVYSLGVVLAECLTGRLVLDASTEVGFRVPAAPEPLAPGETPEPLRSAIRRATARRPEDRFATAEEMAAALVAGEGPERRVSA